MKSSILRLGFYHLSVCLTLRRMAVTHLKIHWKLCNEFKVRVCYHCHAAAAKSLQSCLTLCDPIDGSPPGSPVLLGFSRQEHWSGLPFPSPMHESEKWKWSHSVVSDSQRPHGLQPIRLLRPWDFPGKSTAVGCHGLLQYHCYRLLLLKVREMGGQGWWKSFHHRRKEQVADKYSFLYGNNKSIQYFFYLFFLLTKNYNITE